jgi:hypothetical protein
VLARQKSARVLAAARSDIALLRRKRGDIAAAFYDMGEALVRLKEPGVYRAFKQSSWEAFCRAELAMSESQAERLIEIVTHMTREDAMKLGTFSKASSVARLVQASTADETVAHAIRKGVVVGKRRIDVNRASVRGIAEATREISRPRGTRGRHPSLRRRRGPREAPRSRRRSPRSRRQAHREGGRAGQERKTRHRRRARRRRKARSRPRHEPLTLAVSGSTPV